jgi:hypothetical protein
MQLQGQSNILRSNHVSRNFGSTGLGNATVNSGATEPAAQSMHADEVSTVNMSTSNSFSKFIPNR